MGTFSIWHWLIVLVVVLLLFGGSGKISTLMGDLAKGIKSFKKGLKDEEDEAIAADSPQAIEGRHETTQARTETHGRTGTES